MRFKITLSILAGFLLLLLITAPLQFGWAQEPPPTEWDRLIGGPWDDCAYSVQQTTDGGYILAGYRDQEGGAAGTGQAWLVKTDSEGYTTWEKTLGTTWTDPCCVQQTTDGGYVYAGTKYVSVSNNEQPDNTDAWLVKTDPDGNIVWEKTFGGTGGDGACSVQQTTDGGYVLAGCIYSFPSPTKPYDICDAWLIKTDSEGNETWDKTFGGADLDFANSVRQTADGGYIIGGGTGSYGVSSESLGMGSMDAWLIKTDSEGNETWDKTIGGLGQDQARSIRQTTDGGYILAGDLYIDDVRHLDAWLIKTDSAGNKTWEKTYGDTDDDDAYSVEQTADGGYIVAGYIFGAGARDGWLIKTDSAGNKTWDRTFGGDDVDVIYCAQPTGDGSYILAGLTMSFGAQRVDAWLIKDPFRVTSITPKQASNLGTVHISNLAGSGFKPGAEVTLEPYGDGPSISADNVVVSDTKITCDFDLKGAAFGQYDVVVRNPDENLEARLIKGFSINNVTITSISPASGSKGTKVTITGSNFGSRRGTSAVSFNETNAVSADYVSWSANKIVVRVPGGVGGKPLVKVTTTAGPSNGVYFGVVPQISSLRPSYGRVGTWVTINGQGFGEARPGSTIVYFGSTLATDYDFWTNTQIKVMVPAKVKGLVQVKVGTSGGTSPSARFLVY